MRVAVHAAGKRVGQTLGYADILEHTDRRIWLRLDRDIDVAR